VAAEAGGFCAKEILMKQSKLLMVALGVACLAALAVQSLAQGVTILNSFPADSGRGYYRHMPDGSGAVGPDHVVDFDGLNVVVHDKATGRVLKRMTQVEFWSSVQPANTLVPPMPDSPRMLFDPTSGRWIAVLLHEKLGHRVPIGLRHDACKGGRTEHDAKAGCGSAGDHLLPRGEAETPWAGLG
jgi:hypothetical protein